MLMEYREMEIEDRWNGCASGVRRLGGTSVRCLLAVIYPPTWIVLPLLPFLAE